MVACALMAMVMGTVGGFKPPPVMAGSLWHPLQQRSRALVASAATAPPLAYEMVQGQKAALASGPHPPTCVLCAWTGSELTPFV